MKSSGDVDVTDVDVTGASMTLIGVSAAGSPAHIGQQLLARLGVGGGRGDRHDVPHVAKRRTGVAVGTHFKE